MQSAKRARLELTELQEKTAVEFTIKFVEESNKKPLKNEVLAWLKADFKSRGNPSPHFWHNSSTIGAAFDTCHALVALNKQQHCIGYLIWDTYDDFGVEINIVEVQQEYRRQGVLKEMLKYFHEAFPKLCFLSGRILPASEKIFERVGWKKIGSKHIKILKPSSPPLDTLPDGSVIAISSEDLYTVKANREKYRDTIQYFNVKLTKDNQLCEPVIARHNYEGYIGIYVNKKLITEGKPKHLFKESYVSFSELLIINKIAPINPTLFEEFFVVAQQNPSHDESTLSQERLAEPSPSHVRQTESNEKQKNPLLFLSATLGSFKPEEKSALSSDVNEIRARSFTRSNRPSGADS